MQMNIVPSSIRLSEARNGHNLLQQPLNCSVNQDQLSDELQMMLLFPTDTVKHEQTIKGTQQLPKECNLTQSVPFKQKLVSRVGSNSVHMYGLFGRQKMNPVNFSNILNVPLALQKAAK